MKKLRCMIVDDEPVARKLLQEFVQQVPFLDWQGNFENALKAEAFLEESATDLLFLDIEMPKLSGLQFLQKRDVDALAILTTAFPRYALEGYELDVIDYLLKPIAFTRFLKAVHKARDYYQLKQAAAPAQPLPYLFVKSEKRIEKVALDQILYAESVGNYVRICTEAKTFLAYLTLKSLEAQLPQDTFIKIHHSYQVNYTQIDAIDGNALKVGSKTLPMSRNHRETLMKLVNQRLLKR